MASEIRVNQIQNRSGLSTVTFSDTGAIVSGIVTAESFSAASGTFSGAISAASGTITGNLGVGGVLTYEDVTNIDSVGVITARSGIDAASNLLLKTGGTERVRITSTGNVGLGTITPVGASGKTLDISGGSGQARIAFHNDTTGYASGDGSQIFADGNTLGLQARESAGIIQFETAGGERLRIGSAGQFGIGGANYGTSGQVLTSGGASGAVSWKGGGGLQVLEQFSSPADGSSFTTNKGTVTVQNPTNYQSLTTALNDAQGSVITYQPPDGAVQVIYEFQYAIASDTDSNAILGARLLWDGQEITHSRFGQRGGTNYFDQLNTFKWVFNIGGSTDYSVGRLASWTSGKVIKLQMSEHNSDYEFAINLLRNYGSSGAINVFRRPIISITAIGTPS